MKNVFVVFSLERDNPFSTRSIVGICDTLETARCMVSLNEDSYVQCVIQEWDVNAMQDLNKSSWNVTIWDDGHVVVVKRVHLREDTKPENKILKRFHHFGLEMLIWANSKEAAIEEARRMMSNEGSNKKSRTEEIPENM